MQGEYKKKKLLVLVPIIILFVVVIVLLLIDAREEDEVFIDSYDQTVNILNNTFDTQMYLYGEDIYFRDNVPIKRIDSIQGEDLLSAKDINILIIGDENGTCSLDIEDVKAISDIVNNGKLALFYIGTSKVGLFYETGIWNSERLGYGELGLAVMTHFRFPTCWSGVWTEYDKEQLKNDPEGLGQSILDVVQFSIDSNK